MKNRLQFFTLLFFAVAAQQSVVVSFCQTKYGIPFIYSIHIPAKIGVSQFDNRPPYMTDTSFNENSSVDGNSGTIGIDLLNSYNQKGDTIDISYYIQRNAPWLIGNEYGFHFVVDTAAKLLRNISLGFHYHYVATRSDYQTEYIVSFKSLPYQQEPDSTIIVSDSGTMCRKNIDAISYSKIEYTSYGQFGGVVIYSRSNSSFISLLEDTASYRCSLTISPYHQISAVKSLNSADQILNFVVTQSLPDHSIHFSFPSSIDRRSLIIHDILGRKVSSVEIPSESSTSVLSSVGFPRGTFFAVLGLQIGHFEIH